MNIRGEKMKKILICDDEKDIVRLIKIYLENEGYETLTANNGQEALEILSKENADLIVLDVMMPVMDGIETCLKIREFSIAPIIFLSAKTEDMDKIMGLSSGADDYLAKPFNPLELIARVKAQFRRLEMIQPENISKKGLMVQDIRVDLDSHMVFKGDKEIALTPTEFDMLVYLMKNLGRVLTIKQLYETVWEEEFLDSRNTIMVHIRKLREKIENDSKNPTIIKTVWGVGYKIEK